VLRVCSEGPEEVLNQTDVSQPAIYTCSLAALESLRNSDSEACSDIERTGLAAGLSLGEYTALTFAGSIGFEDGLRLVKERGEAMQAASQQNPGGMASVVGLRLDQTQELVRRAKENTGDADNAMLEVANILCPGNYTISGSTNAIDEAEKLAQDSGSELKAKRFIRLPVAGAFHTQLMNPAAERLKQALDKVEVAKPKLSVLSNATAREYASTSDVRELLKAQLVSPVRFEECIRYMLECGFGQCYEIGPGQAIAGLLKRMQPPASVSSISA
jgi:[acyl-carrier-protein] S-malonyltransferase